MALPALAPLLAASALALPQPAHSFSSAVLAAQRDSDGVAVARLFVAPDRRIADCEMVASDFSKAEDERICEKLLQKRARKAAVGPDGEAAYGNLVYLVASLGDADAAALKLNMPPDFLLEVDTGEGSADDIESVLVNVLLDLEGRVSGCEAADGATEDYAAAACSQLAGQDWAVRTDADGNPVAYVDSLKIDFVARQAAR